MTKHEAVASFVDERMPGILRQERDMAHPNVGHVPIDPYLRAREWIGYVSELERAGRIDRTTARRWSSFIG